MKEDSDQALGSSTKPATKYRIIIGQPFPAHMIKTQDFQRNGKKFSSNGISVAIAWTTTSEPYKVKPLSKRAIMVQRTRGRGIALFVARCTHGFVVRPADRGSNHAGGFDPRVCAVPRCFVSTLSF
jgi:hypothetical protein